MKININLGLYTCKIGCLLVKKRFTPVIGYTNKCKDGSYVVFLDYDNVPYKWIETELKHLQELFCIGDFHVFESTSGSYHAVCFSKLQLVEYLDLLQNSSIDPQYHKIPLYNGKRIWTLRLTDKDKPIKYYKFVESELFGIREQSLAHIKLIEKLFNLEIDKTGCDKGEKLVLARYPL